MYKYCVLGSDQRTICLKKILESEGKEITDFKSASVIIGPVPFSRDGIKINGDMVSIDEIIENSKEKIVFGGVISQGIKEKFKNSEIKFYDLLEIEEVAIKNAIPTAEGAIQTAMEITDFTITGSNVLVLGYGNIGKVLSKMLNGMGARVFCEARKEKDIAMIRTMGYNEIDLDKLECHLDSFDIIFNTVPVKILDEKRLKMVKKNCAIIDLASSPGGIDFEIAKELKINVVWALALPSKVAPYSSATYLKEAIDKILIKTEE